ncbi:MAG: hypothetical protein M3063_17085, partial [Actinomycetota bacterium]|nr:hypothetical protein [Actinomycetota bacterium]
QAGAGLAAEHRRLGAALATSLPRDQTEARRAVGDERQWRRDSGRGPDPVLERQSSDIEGRAGARDRWITANAARLARWDALGQAIEDGEDLAAHARDATLPPGRTHAPELLRAAPQTRPEVTARDLDAGAELGWG